MTSPATKYAAALIQLAIVLVGALAQFTGRLTLLDGVQLIPLAATAFLVYLVPLLGVNSRSGWKTGVAVVGAVAAAAIPFLRTGHITGPQVAIVVLAGLQVLGAHIGVQIRNDARAAADTALAVPTQASRPGTAAVAEPPTATTVNRAIEVNAGEFIGEAAR